MAGPWFRSPYKKLQVLKGVDFDVARGSIFALLGSNGAGKTTIVRILTTLLKPDDGTPRVNGFDVLSQPARVRESISLTGQFAAVDEILTGRENLIMIAELRHVKGAGKVADDLLRNDSASRRGRAPGVDLLRRLAPSPRHRHEHASAARRSSSSTSRPPALDPEGAALRCGR